MVSLWFRKVSCSGFRIRTQQAPGASLGRFLSGFLSPRHRGSRALTLSLQTSARFAHHVEGDEFRCKKNKDVCRAQAVESHADVLGNSDGWEMFQRIRNSEGGVGWFCRSLKSMFVSLAPLGAPGDLRPGLVVCCPALRGWGLYGGNRRRTAGRRADTQVPRSVSGAGTASVGVGASFLSRQSWP